MIILVRWHLLYTRIKFNFSAQLCKEANWYHPFQVAFRMANIAELSVNWLVGFQRRSALGARPCPLVSFDVKTWALPLRFLVAENRPPVIFNSLHNPSPCIPRDPNAKRLSSDIRCLANRIPFVIPTNGVASLHIGRVFYSFSFRMEWCAHGTAATMFSIDWNIYVWHFTVFYGMLAFSQRHIAICVHGNGVDTYHTTIYCIHAWRENWCRKQLGKQKHLPLWACADGM